MSSLNLVFSSPSSCVTAIHKKNASLTYSKNHLHFSDNHSFGSPIVSVSTPSFSPFSSKKKETQLYASDDSSDSIIEDSDSNAESAEIVENKVAPRKRIEIPKGEEVFAVVMIGSRQYIVFPGRFIQTQRLKGANVNDKIILNKVLLVGTKEDTYIGKPVVPNAVVHAVVEDQGLDDKVIVFKYKKRKHYRRTIGHRQPNTRIKITGITGYQDSPAVSLAVA